MTTTTDVFAEIRRDQWGRPLVLPPGGRKEVGYQRVTTFVGSLEDTTNLSKWSQRMVILGLTDRPDLLLSAAAHREDKTVLNRIAEDAAEAAKAHAAATVGTALHALCEQIDRGDEIGSVPEDYRADLAAYVEATRNLKVLHNEQFVVVDEYQVGGTPDRIVEFEGERYIADIKTGSIEWGAGKIAMQLAVYAHGQFYDQASKTRTPLPAVNGQRGIIIHLPAGTGTCRLYWVDIASGWEQCETAAIVRDWRKRRDLITPLNEATAVGNLADAGLISPSAAARVAAEPSAHAPLPESPSQVIAAQIAQAGDARALVAVWEANADRWTPELTALAAARKAQLAGG